MSNIDISVIVATYNPNFEKLVQTLKSILVQEKCNYEIIIADDGSKNFDELKICNWMKQNEVSNYEIVKNEKNVGTVKNVYSGLLKAKGKYVKLISPGDFLYDKNTLKNIYDYMESNKYKVIFGRTVYYRNDNNKVKLINKSNPLNLKAYINKNNKEIKKNYLLYNDYILGAALVWETTLFTQYISKMIEKVIYCEDISVLLLVSDDIEIGFWNNYIIWYESNTGISTSGNDAWKKKLRQDNENGFKMIADEHKNLSKFYKLHYGKYRKLHILYKINYKIKRKIFEITNKINYDNVDVSILENILKS